MVQERFKNSVKKPSHPYAISKLIAEMILKKKKLIILNLNNSY